MEIIRKPVSLYANPKKDTALIAIGDIHGQFELFQRILSVAKKALPKNVKQVDLVLLGDIIDRGDAALEVLDVIRHGIEDWNVITILGNHEQLLLRVLNAPDNTYRMQFALWRGNGGISTLENLKIDIPPVVEIGATEHRKRLIKALGPKRIKQLNDFQSHYISGNILCVHGGIDPQKSIEENFKADFLSQHPLHWAWIRDDFLDHSTPYPDNHFVVHGHTIIPGPRLENHRIGLDTGACIHGVLTGAVFHQNSMTIFQVTQD